MLRRNEAAEKLIVHRAIRFPGSILKKASERKTIAKVPCTTLPPVAIEFPQTPPQNTPAEPRPSGSGITTRTPRRKSQGTWHLHGRYGTHGTNGTDEKGKSKGGWPRTGPERGTTDFQSVGSGVRPMSIGRSGFGAFLMWFWRRWHELLPGD